jgi:hypothetical protein
VTIRQHLIARLWAGKDPFDGFTATMAPDLQGWNSSHPYLIEAIDRFRPALVVEIGVWKGGSVLTLAERLRQMGCPGVVLAVDTWLGSSEHWIDPALTGLIPRQFGFPLMYFQFLSNVAHAGLTEQVLPLPQDSANAAEIVAALGLAPAVIHLDAAHDEAAVTADLDRWWPLLAPGGMLIADDYDATGRVWPSVGRAVEAFLDRTPHEGFAALPYKCRFTKPA